jgi:hypothetical protein
MQKFTIEKGIEKPKGKRAKYPFSKMEIGDIVIMAEVYSRQLAQKYFTAAKNYGTRWGKKFSAKKTEDGKLRIWRIK